MGNSWNPKPERRIIPESGLEPHFHITDVTYEILADGNLHISAYEERRGELRLQFSVTMMPANLLRAARAATAVAADAHNVAMFRDLLGNGEPH